ncbi:MAG: hypothetical protein ACK5LN_07375 [Propioniciclava sp.]
MSHRPVRRRSLQALTVAIISGLVLTGCGFNAQTLQPYTPAEGVNIDIGDIKVRNVVVVADETGHGVVSGSLVARTADSVASVAVLPIGADDTVGEPLTVTELRPVALPARDLVVLTDPSPAFALSGSDLTPGLTVAISLTFASGASERLIAPVVSSEDTAFVEVGNAIPTPEPTSPTPAP